MMYGTHFSILNTYWKPLWPECAILYIIQEFSKLFSLLTKLLCIFAACLGVRVLCFGVTQTINPDPKNINIVIV